METFCLPMLNIFSANFSWTALIEFTAHIATILGVGFAIFEYLRWKKKKQYNVRYDLANELIASADVLAYELGLRDVGYLNRVGKSAKHLARAENNIDNAMSQYLTAHSRFVAVIFPDNHSVQMKSFNFISAAREILYKFDEKKSVTVDDFDTLNKAMKELMDTVTSYRA